MRDSLALFSLFSGEVVKPPFRRLTGSTDRSEREAAQSTSLVSTIGALNPSAKDKSFARKHAHTWSKHDETRRKESAKCIDRIKRPR